MNRGTREIRFPIFGRRLSRLLCGCLFCFFAAANVAAQSELETLGEIINRGRSDEQKRDALSQIRNLRTEAAARLAIPALRDRSEIVRATAARSVVLLPPTESFAVLAPLLRDKSILVRKEAAYALGATGNPHAVRALVEIIQRDKIQEVKDAATVALGSIGDAAALDALTQILRRRPQSKEEFFRRAAARSVGQIAQFIQTGARRVVTPENFLPESLKETAQPDYKNLSETVPAFRAVVPVLIQTLENPREFADVRREAAFALGAIGDEAAVPALRVNLQNPDYYLAEICREALLKISPEPK